MKAVYYADGDMAWLEAESEEERVWLINNARDEWSQERLYNEWRRLERSNQLHPIRSGS